MLNGTITPVPNYRADSIADGYVYECSCGELYSDAEVAYHCRKCRKYCVFGYCTHVVDIRTDEVVLGKVPSAERYEEASKVALKEAAEERALFALQEQMWRQEGELYDAEILRLAQLAHAIASDAAEDRMWAIEDALMGY